MLILLAFLSLWNGTEYAANSSVQKSHAEILLDQLHLKGDEQILEIGCRDGKTATKLVALVPNGSVLGLDASPSMIEKASSNQLPNLNFAVGTIDTLSRTFDEIISIHGMHWIKEQAQALSNIYAHLNQGGHIHFVLSPTKEGLPFHTALLKTMSHYDFSDFVNPQQVYDLETYRSLLTAAGFHVDALHYVYHESSHADKTALKGWIKQWLPHWRYLPTSDQEPFLNELIDTYLLESNASSPIIWGEYVLFVEATKRS